MKCLYVLVSALLLASCGTRPPPTSTTLIPPTPSQEGVYAETLQAGGLATLQAWHTQTALAPTPTPFPTTTPGPSPTSEPTPTSTPTPSPLSSTGEVTFELVAQRWGETHSLAVQGHTVFLGMGPRLLAIDASSPAAPHVVAKSEALPGVVSALVVRGGVAYVAAGKVLVSLDVRDPGRITRLGALELPGLPLRLLLSGNVLYAGGTVLTSPELLLLSGDHHGMLAAIDVSAPGYPRLLDSAEFRYPITALALVDRFLYAGVQFDANIYQVEVGDPARLGQAQTVRMGPAVSLTLLGDTLIAGGGLSFSLWDVSDPAFPQQKPLPLVGTPAFGFVGVVDTAATRGDTLYLMSWYDEDAMYAAWITAIPTTEAFGDPPDYLVSSMMALADDLIFAADDGLKIYRPQNPIGEPVGQLATALIQDVALSEDVGFVVNGGGHLLGSESQFIALNLPSLDQLGVYTYDREGYWQSLLSVALEGNLAYLNAWGGGLRILDVSDPARPSLLISLSSADGLTTPDLFGGETSALAARGSRAFLPLSNRPGFDVIDVSAPGSPQIQAVGTDYIVFSVMAATDDLLYAMGPSGGTRGANLYLIDARSGDWQTLSTIPFPGQLFDVEAWGDRALVATDQGLTLLSAADPAHPLVVGERALPDGAYSIARVGETALVSSLGDAGRGRLYAIDLGDIAGLPLGIFDLPIGRAEVAAGGGWALVGSQPMGLYLLRMGRQ